MKDTFSIKENRDFRRAYRKGVRKTGKYIIVYVCKSPFVKDGQPHGSRLGITVGKRFGNSVQRNHFKRLVRESFRAVSENFDEVYDVVVVARPSVRTAATPKRKLRAEKLPSFKEIQEDMKTSLAFVKRK